MVDELDSGAAVDTGSAPTGDSGTTPDQATSTAPSGSAGQFVDITDPDRYRYNGRSVKEWDSGYMRQQDYSSKTQALAQERRYYDNLSVDLERVKQAPQLAEQFKQIYPEKFHAYLRYVMGETPTRPQQVGQPQAQQQYAQMDPRFESRLQRMEEANRAREVSLISSELDTIYDRMAKKYPFADQEAVTARAQALFQAIKQQDPLNPNIRITEKQWDALWKSHHEQAQKIAEARYKQQVKDQISASRKGSDAGGGGGVPGQAPRQYKTIKEASDQARADSELGVW